MSKRRNNLFCRWGGHSCPPRAFLPAFTIVELMISIAMVVILMVGIHQIFKMSSDTVGMGQAVADMSRSNRSVQGIFHDDYQRLMKDAPLFIIRSGVSGVGPNWGAFTTEAERAADRDGNPLTQDLDGNGVEGEPSVNGEITPLSIYNSRNHRVDVVGFPAHGLFHRHTANDGSYSSSLTSQDAFIFYEHVAQPTYNTGGTPPLVYYDPGDPAPGNRNNYLAGQWILGRVALLMRDSFATSDNWIVRDTTVPPLTPLRYGSLSNVGSYLLHDSRYDLLGASLETLRQDVADVRLAAGKNADSIASSWWQPLVYHQPTAGPVPNNNAVNSNPVSRFYCNPRISKPITSEAMAKAMPVLLTNCSQFIVEYAGDFVSQDNAQFTLNTKTNLLEPNPNWGYVTEAVPDGVIDYVVDHSGVTNSNYNVAARIRWYGLPRDTNGDRVIAGFSGSPGFPRASYAPGQQYVGPTNSNELVDVVPLRDVISTIRDPFRPGLLYPNFLGTAFERELPLLAPGGDYMAGMMNAPANVQATFRYTCVWVNNAPTMIRIVLKLEDPAGRLPEGQWYEYVVGAP